MKWRYEALQHPLTNSSNWSEAFMFSPRCYTFSGGAVLISRRQNLAIARLSCRILNQEKKISQMKGCLKKEEV